MGISYAPGIFRLPENDRSLEVDKHRPTSTIPDHRKVCNGITTLLK
jgi:hypothetical protein